MAPKVCPYDSIFCHFDTRFSANAFSFEQPVPKEYIESETEQKIEVKN